MVIMKLLLLLYTEALCGILKSGISVSGISFRSRDWNQLMLSISRIYDRVFDKSWRYIYRNYDAT